MIDEELTVLEAFNAIKDGAVVHVGTENGSGFFFVGTKQEYIDSIDALTEKARKSTKKSLQIQNRTLKKLMTEYDCLKYENKTFKRKHDIRNLLNTLEADIKERKDLVERWEKINNEFIPFRERKILKIYERSSHDGIVVIVPGYEYGRFWFYKDPTMDFRTDLL